MAEADSGHSPAGAPRRSEATRLIPVVIGVAAFVVALVSAWQADWLTAVSGAVVALTMVGIVVVRHRPPTS